MAVEGMLMFGKFATLNEYLASLEPEQDQSQLTDAQRLKEIRELLPKARRFSDDGNWPECYYDDVRFLLRLVAKLRKGGA